MTESSALLKQSRKEKKASGSDPSSDISLRHFQKVKPSLWISPHTGELPLVLSSHAVESDLSKKQFFMHIVRASIGTGVLALPSAVANAGLLFGICGIIVVSLILLHCNHILVECTQFLRIRHRLANSVLDYGNTVRGCLTFGAAWSKRLLWTAKILDAALLAMQFGLCTVFLLFISENIKYLVDHYAPNFGWSLTWYLLGTTLVVSISAFVRPIRILANISAFGNVFMVLCLTIILFYCFQDIPDVAQYPMITNFERIPLFFGVAVIAFEAANVLLPAENALKDKDSLLGWNGLLNFSLGLVALIYLTMAFFGYVKFGDSVGGSLTYSMPMTPWYYMIVKPMYALLIAMTFGAQFYIWIDVVWQLWVTHFPKSMEKMWINNLLRLLSLIAMFSTAALVPYIEHVLSLIGALAGSFICMIFPPFIHTSIFWDHSYDFSCFSLTVTKNISLIVLGVVGGLIGTYTSIVAIIAESRKSDGFPTTMSVLVNSSLALPTTDPGSA